MNKSITYYKDKVGKFIIHLLFAKLMTSWSFIKVKEEHINKGVFIMLFQRKIPIKKNVS